MDNSQREHINSLIIGISKGEESALLSLYREIGGRMLSVARGVTGDRFLAEDAVQEALLKIVKYARSFRRADNGYGWVMTIVRNESLSVVRKYKPNHDDIDALYQLGDGGRQGAALLERADIARAMSMLNEKERELIFLRYLCDMQIREIGRTLSLPKSTVAYALKKAEERLRQILASD